MDPSAADSAERVPHGGTDDPRVLDFSTTANPETPQGVTRVYDAALSAARRYPADDYGEFRAAAAEHVGCEPAQAIPTAGAMAGIRLVFGVAVDRGDSVVLPEPSSGEFGHEARLQGAETTAVAHDAVTDVDPSDHDLVVVCTPNNPTGESLETGDLRALAERCRAAEAVLLADEAFADFTERASLAAEPGVVVVRSLSKTFGLPGLRSGFLVATGRLRDRLDAARVSWGLSTPAAAVGTYCLRQREFVVRTRERVATERERMRDRLEARFDVFDSDAPFLLFDVGEADPGGVLEAVRERGIALRDARTFAGLDNHLRAAVRRPSENDRLLDALGV